jgi:hypothetical protein
MRYLALALLFVGLAACAPELLPTPQPPQAQSAAGGACARDCMAMDNQCLQHTGWFGWGFGARTARNDAIRAKNACTEQLSNCYRTCPP